MPTTNRPLLTVFMLGVTFLFPVSAAVRATTPIGAEVQAWHYDAAAKQVTVRLMNTSNKDITAFNLSVTEKYADGVTSSSEKMTDYLPLMASVAAGLQGNDNGTFPAGTSRDVTFPEAKDPIDVFIVVDMVGEPGNPGTRGQNPGDRRDVFHASRLVATSSDPQAFGRQQFPLPVAFACLPQAGT